MKFSGVCLLTGDVPVLKAFYETVLQVQSEGNEVHAELHTEGGSVSIFSNEGMERMAPGSTMSQGHGGFTLGFEVQDVDAEFDRLKRLGVDFILLPTTHPWGSRSMWFRDPDGNIVDFYAVVNGE
jgi:uncharacterized glyoxalase superfamily protein PhnB